jgi:type IX secretion system PorP/SprF family membrane protein
MKYYIKHILFLIINLISCALSGQSLHFSQFRQMEVFYNPATAGFFDGDYRFHAIHRNQYRSVPVPYSTFSAGGDFRPGIVKGLQSGAGIMFNNDQAGDSKFYTRQILISGSVIKSYGKDSSLTLSLGVQPGVTFMGIDESGLTFENQFQGDRYNAGIDPGENFSRLKVTLPELNTGLSVRKQKNARNIMGGGLSFQHLMRPQRSLFGNPEQWQSARINLILYSVFRISEKGDLLPEVLLQGQKKYRSYVTGMRYRHWLPPVEGNPTAVYAGLYYRIHDAAIACLQMDYRSFTAGISYDITMSSLIRANNRRGGFEISLVYIFRKPRPFIPQKKFCPVYL